MKRNDKFTIIENKTLEDNDFILRICPKNENLEDIHPGQFLNILIPNSQETFLRRPFSICDVNEIELLIYVKIAGKGTKVLSNCKSGDILDVIYPLGKGFNYRDTKHPVLLGGGAGIAPMIFLSKQLLKRNIKPTILLAGKTKNALSIKYLFSEFCNLYYCTDDGSLGEKGLITQHSLFENLKKFDKIFCCGPTPMMKAVSAKARENNITCEVSLENTMACGLGACLCCVTPTKEGHKCVCTEGPVFDSRELIDF